MIRAGDMRFQIEIQERSSALDSAGQQVETWTTLTTRRASVQRTPGAEFFNSMSHQGRVPTVFRLRYPVELTKLVGPEMRVLFGTRVYNIISAVDQAGIKEELIITALENLGETP